jgi:hypothetical protein
MGVRLGRVILRFTIQLTFAGDLNVGGISERGKEIKRRRKRRVKLQKLSKRLKKATASEKAVIATKVRNLTSGAETIIERWGLEAK